MSPVMKSLPRLQVWIIVTLVMAALFLDVFLMILAMSR